MERIYLITGVLGHLGSTVARMLLAEKKTVWGFDKPIVKHNDLLNEKIKLFYGDIRSLEDVEKCFSNDYEMIVIHCAGIVSIKSHYDELVYSVNVFGTKNILDLCQKYHVKKLVHVSSVHAIPEGKNHEVLTEVEHYDENLVHGLYAKTKAKASEFVLEATRNGLDASIIQPSGIIGPYDLGNGHLTSMIVDYLNGNLTAMVNGGYDFVDVRDVACGILSCVERGRKGESYLITNHYFTLKMIMDKVSELSHHKKIKTVLPLWFARFTSPLSELYYKIRRKPPLYTSYSLYTLQANSNFSHEKATKELLYTPRNMDETLKDTIAFLRENNIIKKSGK